MGDEIDRAQANDEFFRELALRNHPRPDGLPLLDKEGVGGRCEDCGAPIPEARRKAVPGCKRCVACQNEFENIHTHWRAL